MKKTIKLMALGIFGVLLISSFTLATPNTSVSYTSTSPLMEDTTQSGKKADTKKSKQNTSTKSCKKSCKKTCKPHAE
jgi:hypothetical protein